MSGHLNYMIDFLVLLGIPKTVLEPNLVQDCARKSKTWAKTYVKKQIITKAGI